MTLPHEFIFVFIQYFNGAILSKKSCKKPEVRKNTNRGPGGVGHMAGGKGLSIEGAVFRPSAHYAIRINIYIYIYKTEQVLLDTRRH